MTMKTATDKVHEIEIDLCFESMDDLLQQLETFCRNGVRCDCLHANGPAGGNPTFYLTGTQAKIEKSLPEFFADVSFEEYLSDHV